MSEGHLHSENELCAFLLWIPYFGIRVHQSEISSHTTGRTIPVRPIVSVDFPPSVELPVFEWMRFDW